VDSQARNSLFLSDLRSWTTVASISPAILLGHTLHRAEPRYPALRLNAMNGRSNLVAALCIVSHAMAAPQPPTRTARAGRRFRFPLYAYLWILRHASNAKQMPCQPRRISHLFVYIRINLYLCRMKQGMHAAAKTCHARSGRQHRPAGMAACQGVWWR